MSGISFFVLKERRPRLPLRALAVAGAIAVSLWAARPGTAWVNWGGLPQFGKFWAASLQPDLSGEFLALIARATAITLAYAVCGTTLSVGLGLVGGILASATWWRALLPESARGGWLGRPLWSSVRGLLAFPRAIHELIWGLFLLGIVGLDPLAAVLAIAIPYGATVAKVFSELLDETPQESFDALLAAGAAPATAWVYGLLPQALPNLLSYSFYRFECSLRSAAVLGIIGAGGLGYEIFLSLQSLRYEQLWTGFYALILLVGAVDMGSAWVRQQLAASSPAAKLWLRLSWGAIAAAIPLCFWGLAIDWSRLGSPQSWQRLGEFLVALVPRWPDGALWQALLQLSGLTLAMSVLATALASLGGVLFSVLAVWNFALPGEPRWAWLRGVTLSSRLVLLVARAIPAPIWALVFLFVLFPGILPGALALGAHNCGVLGRLMAETNENLDDRPARSLQALGASAGQVALYGILAPNAGRFWAYSLYRWEVCLRETAIVGLVGAGGLGRQLTEQLSSFDYGGLSLTLGCFLLLTILVDSTSQVLRAVLK